MGAPAFLPCCVALDLEMNQPSGRIFQVGAAVGDLRSGQLLGRFSVYVNPLEPLEPRIQDLCGVTDEVVRLAGTLDEAYEGLRLWMAPYAEKRQLNPLTWGGDDAQTLQEQLGAPGNGWPFGRRWVDVKTVFVAWQHANEQQGQGGLATSMKKVGLVFEGRKHDAADDAVNTFRMYHRLLQRIKNSAS